MRLSLVKKLEAAGLEVVSHGRNSVEFVGDSDKASEVLGPDWGGFMSGYGSWCYSKGYVSKGDWNDKSSAWHY
jgi:hypothetical protein